MYYFKQPLECDRACIARKFIDRREKVFKLTRGVVMENDLESVFHFRIAKSPWPVPFPCSVGIIFPLFHFVRVIGPARLNLALMKLLGKVPQTS